VHDQNVAERERGQQQGLDREPRDRADRSGLAQQTVERERERERQRDPRRLSGRDVSHSTRSPPARSRSPAPAQPLAQHQHAERDVDQRVDEVAEAASRMRPDTIAQM